MYEQVCEAAHRVVGSRAKAKLPEKYHLVMEGLPDYDALQIPLEK